jgi:ribosomal protein S18 acetylase RimI-like enzyme
MPLRSGCVVSDKALDCTSVLRNSGCATREAVAGDAKIIADLYRREAELHQGLSGYYRLRPDFDWVAYVRRIMRRRECTIFVAETGSVVVGFILVRVVRYGTSSPNRLNLLARWRRCEPAQQVPLVPTTWTVIEDCYVLQSARRRGIGAALATSALEWSKDRGVPRVELGVLASNTSAAAFWRKLGFAEFRHQMHRCLG